MTSEKSNRIILPLMIVTVMFAGAFALNQSEDVDAGYVYGEDYLLDPVVNGSYGYTNDCVGVESVHRITNPSSGSVLEIEIMGISGGSSYSLYYTITEISGTWSMYTPYASDRYTSDDVGNGFMIGMGMYNYIRFGSSSENVRFNIVESQAYTTTATVHYDANGGTDAPEPTVKTINSLESIEGTTTVRLSNSEPTLSDLEFLGWSESPTATTSTNTYATHYYGQPGTYTATLTVFNNYGSDTTEYIIEVPEMAVGRGAMKSFSTPLPGFWRLSSGVWSSEGSFESADGVVL